MWRWSTTGKPLWCEFLSFNTSTILPTWKKKMNAVVLTPHSLANAKMKRWSTLFYYLLHCVKTDNLSAHNIAESLKRKSCTSKWQCNYCAFVCLLFEQVEVLADGVNLLYPHKLKKDSHNTVNFLPYTSWIVCGFFNICIYETKKKKTWKCNNLWV